MLPKTIKKIITLAHDEAQFRLELWFALSRLKYTSKYTSTHAPNKAYTVLRKAEWKIFLDLVHTDRANNEAEAHLNRMQHLEDHTRSSDDDRSDTEALDPKYYS